MRGERSRAEGRKESGCVKRSVKRRRRGKESREVIDMWREGRGESESLKVFGLCQGSSLKKADNENIVLRLLFIQYLFLVSFL